MSCILGLLALAVFSLCPAPASAQIKEGQSVDKIVAVAGNEVILQSDVQTQMALLAQQDPSVLKDQNNPQLLRRVLDALVNEKLILIKAMEDSVTVSEDEVTERLNYQIQALVQQLGSEKRVEDVYGMSIARIKRDFREEIRKQLLTERKKQQKFMDVKPSQREVETFYRDYRDSLPLVPEQYELYHIVKYVDATTAAKDEARNLAQRVRDSILAGGSFGDFAKRYSADPGSASADGELGFVEKGKLVPEYEKVAQNLKPNEISEPVETPFGFHIIQLIEKRQNSINTKHILFKIGQSNEDVERTKTFLLSLKQQVEAGANFEELAREHSEDEETRAFGGAIGPIEATRLGELSSTVTALPDGGISDPIPYAGSPTKIGFRIVYRKSKIPEHLTSLTNDFKRVEQYATMYKRNKMYEDWVKELRNTIYWEIRDEKYKQ